jgi:threonylcarbamoyladenosine tRNA methylthiotransferase MtaB
MRIHLQALGCRLNEAELESWARQFHQLGHQVTAQPEGADLLVVNTCAVTQEAVRKSRKLLRRCQRQNPRAKLLVTGCYASLQPEETIRLLGGADLVVANQDKHRLVEIARRRLDLHTMPEIATEPDENPLFARGRQRAFVKVQDGCRYRCTFCIVTWARGEERSRPIQVVVDEINQLAEEGIQEVVLTGVHIGGYGSDINSSLSALIGAILHRTSVPRVRLGSVEPWDLPADFWCLFSNPRFMPHLHLPLQSGSDTVLRRMARRCKTPEFTRLVASARQQVPDINLTTDVMVGFPGETEDEWLETLDYVARVGFGHLHIFAYSPRVGTKAADLPDQVPAKIKKTRSLALHALSRHLKRRTLERFLGRSFPVLVEGAYKGSEVDYWFGYTPNYLPVKIPRTSGQDLNNRIVTAELIRLDDQAELLIGNGNPLPSTGQANEYALSPAKT